MRPAGCPRSPGGQVDLCLLASQLASQLAALCSPLEALQAPAVPALELERCSIQRKPSD